MVAVVVVVVAGSLVTGDEEAEGDFCAPEDDDDEAMVESAKFWVLNRRSSQRDVLLRSRVAGGICSRVWLWDGTSYASMSAPDTFRVVEV